MFLICHDNMLLEKHANPSRKWRDRSRGKTNTVSTFRWWSLAADRCASFQEIDGQSKNRRRKCFYFAMMISCCKQIVLQTNWWTGGEWKEKMFLLCHDEMLPLMDVRPWNKLMDRLGTKGENVSFLRWWSVAANRCDSSKQIDGQVENRRRKCFYFAMMICCCKQMWLLQTNWWTGGERNEKQFLLCDDDLLLLVDLRPSRTFTDRSKTEGDTVCTLRWWSFAANRPEFFH